MPPMQPPAYGGLDANSAYAQYNRKAAGPQITPKTVRSTGQGGQAQPPYLQTRTGGNAGQPTLPVVTPKPTAPGDSIGTGGPQITPANAQPKPPAQAGGSSLADVYNFFKSDLMNQTKQAMANTRADASARGVFYGSPLTGSEADINTQYLRGLGQLQAGMYGNEQQAQLARLGMAGGILGMNQAAAPPMPGPIDFSGLGAMLSGSPAVAGQRGGPTISPNQKKQAKGTKAGPDNSSDQYTQYTPPPYKGFESQY